MQNAGLDESKARIKTARINVNNLRHADDTTLMPKSKVELKILLMRVKEESEKPGLKLNIQKTKIVASGLIISWQIEGEKVEAVTDFIFLVSKINADMTAAMKLKDACSLAPWKNSYDKARQVIKRLDMTLPTKVHIVKLWFFL